MKPKHFAIAIAVLEIVLSGVAVGNEVSECRRLAPKYHAATEVRLEDGVRVDLLNDEYAIEVDWCNHKLYEAVGQSVLYSVLTEKKPAILLLVPKGQKKEETEKWLHRAEVITERLKIKLYVEPATTTPPKKRKQSR